MRARALCIGLFLAFALISSIASAQSKSGEITTRAVQGLVTNAAKQPVAQAVVQLKNTKTLEIRSFITQADGMYHFAGLGSDVEYQLKAEHSGVSSSWKTLSVFDTKKTATINLKVDHEQKPKS